jgi:hypothetical protein
MSEVSRQCESACEAIGLRRDEARQRNGKVVQTANERAIAMNNHSFLRIRSQVTIPPHPLRPSGDKTDTQEPHHSLKNLPTFQT